MLIINADDLGMNRTATDNILVCFRKGGITSASSMVFMADSQRAAELALEAGLDTGLHLNFTYPFDGDLKSSKIIKAQQRIASFFKLNKYSSLFYNPFLRRDFEYVYKAQYEEYVRLYNSKPTHIDGHHHMHLCTNMLVDRLTPIGCKVRRSFTFFPGEKNCLNRFYRSIVDSILRRRYICTDFFFSFSSQKKNERLRYIMELAKSWNVELMVHPEKKDEVDHLTADEYLRMIGEVKRGSYVSL